MKTRIFGSLVVLAILAVLYVLTEGTVQSQPGSATESYVPPSASDNDFKNLKIN